MFLFCIPRAISFMSSAHDFAGRNGIRPGGPWLAVKALYHDAVGWEYFFAGMKLATGEGA
jgi:hypothetical protein